MKTCSLAALAAFAASALAAPLADDASLAANRAKRTMPSSYCTIGAINQCADIVNPYLSSCPDCIRSLGGECSTWSFEYINNTWC
ncbi:uncharacterized protein UV8b_07642 [Ustilaginoidea virens]|uniref:Uncharacterized protein n=1 Tax=Ustilaginoidea virens TaxID=1159556 RepID=A0A8E5MKT1_USTVR|nr:uncharacterized protein UV8b_07642 [Ustilaginoidea virens]QUC23401.1 hypothetical protein UV8b_07642 [Ustilaginoidea virens]